MLSSTTHVFTPSLYLYFVLWFEHESRLFSASRPVAQETGTVR